MTSAGHSSLVRSHPALAALPLTAVAVLVGLICLAGAAAMPATAHAAVARGIADSSLTEPTTEATQQNTIDEIQQLHATYVRIFVSWALAAPAAQPAAAADPAFDLSSPYMLGVQSAITKANADGLKVVVTIFESPPWATDSSHWPKGVYQPYVVIKPAGLAYFRAFCQQFAAQFAGQVAAYECWNEPNLGRSLYPQRTSSDSHFAEEHYLSMLKVFKPAIESGDPVHKPIIVGGATAPTGIGGNTPPQVFASWLAKHGAGAYFDVYSHHPYAPGGNRNLAPGTQPNFPKTTVTLGNLSVLLKLFPKKPFWLTEFGYQTAPCRTFGDQYVNQVTQASYLKSAYAFVARYRQVRMLMWFLVRDVAGPSKAPDLGFYTGLDTSNGAHKPAWYAFAGHNSLTIKASATSIRRGATISLAGTLRGAGSPVAKPIVLQSRRAGESWANVKTIATNVSGGYSLTGVRPKSTTYYRLSWPGVATSRTVRVRVR